VPRPHLRRDVVENSNASSSGAPGKREVEARVVYGYEEVDLPFEQELSNLASESAQVGEMPNHLREAQYGQTVEVGK
jgi:hypothetical protein